MRKIELHEQGYSRLPTVLALLPFSRSKWLDGVAKGIYPKSVRCGRVTMWANRDLLKFFKELEG